MKALYAPDTNFFLQFRQASDVAWKDLTPADEVELVILLAVLRELDNHNHGPAGRKRRAAERVLKSIRGLEPGKDVVLRERNPRVVYRELEPLDFKAEIPAWIDISKPDEAALAEILEYRAAGIADLQLLTADQTLVRVARRAGLKAVEPPDDWKLPPEPDPNEKRVADLERRVSAVEGRSPQIRVWPELKEVEVQEIVGTVPRFRPLSSSFIERALDAVQRKHPEPGIPVIGATMQRGVDKYYAERSQWLTRLTDRLTQLHLSLNFQQSLLPMALCLQNNGEAIATGFDVEVDAEGSFCFVDGDDEKVEVFREPPGLPTPPVLKTSVFDDFLSSPVGARDVFRTMPPLPALAPRPDSPEFTWTYDEPLSQSVKGTCGQFRRGRRPECLPLELLVPHDREMEGEVRGRITGWYTADNLVKTGDFAFLVRICLDWQDTEAEAARLLREQLQVEL